MLQAPDCIKQRAVEHYAGRMVAFDASICIFQFLANVSSGLQQQAGQAVQWANPCMHIMLQVGRVGDTLLTAEDCSVVSLLIVSSAGKLCRQQQQPCQGRANA